MATAANPFKNLQDELTCCLCLEYFKHPVSVKKCSHSFCKECIVQHCKKKGTKASCPTCRQDFCQNNLVENRSLANVTEIVQQIKESSRAWGREPENCQDTLGLFYRGEQEASKSQILKLSAGCLLSQLKWHGKQEGRLLLMQSSLLWLKGPWPFCSPRERVGLAEQKQAGPSQGAGASRPGMPRTTLLSGASLPAPPSLTARAMAPCSAGGNRVAVWLKADDLRCSVCLELLSCPATLLCGHSFCLACLRRWTEARARKSQKRSCPNCQRAFPRGLPDRNVLLELLLEQYRRAASDGALPRASSERQAQDEVKISEISAQVTIVCDAVSNMRKDRTEMKDYVSRIKTSITEDFTAMKKYINAQEQMVLEVLDQECREAEQKIDAVVQLLITRTDKLLELQDNSDKLLKNASAEQEVYVGSSTAVDEVTLDVQKIDSIADDVKKLRRSLEMPLLGNCPKKMLQEPSLGASLTSDTPMEEEEYAVPSSSSSSQLQATSQETSGCPSSMDCDRDSSVPMMSSQFSPWATDVTFDLKRINKNLELTNDRKTVTVSRHAHDYDPSPKRFRISQVMGSPGFSEGCHYWEVSTKHSTGWAIGVAVGEIGSNDQLGRTELSWCIEWSGEKLSAWHKGQETQISKEKPLQVGTLLKIPENCLSFYSCSDKETCLHNFEIKTDGPIYPAFWIYGGQEGEFLTICKIKRS